MTGQLPLGVGPEGSRPGENSPRFVTVGAHRRYGLVAGLCRGESVLDVGCGQALLWEHLHQWCNSYTGLDVLPPHTLPETDSFHFIEAEFTPGLAELQQRGQKFDTVVALEVLEHLDATQQHAFLTAMWGVTAKRMILTTPHPDALRYYPFTDHMVGKDNPYHLREMHPRLTERYLANACPDRRTIHFFWCWLEDPGNTDEMVWGSPVATEAPFGYAVLVDR